MRHALDGCRPGADDADPLVLEPGQPAAVVAAGIAVVPAAGVEGVALEVVDPRDAGQLRPAQRPVGHGDVAGLEAIAAAGADGPEPLVLVPLHPGDRGL